MLSELEVIANRMEARMNEMIELARTDEYSAEELNRALIRLKRTSEQINRKNWQAQYEIMKIRSSLPKKRNRTTKPMPTYLRLVKPASLLLLGKGVFSMGNMIKSRIYAVGKRQIDLMLELRQRGYPRMSQSQLSRIISGCDISPLAENVKTLIDEILQDWERKSA